MEFIELELRDFKALVKRSDIKTPTWFAVEHNLLLHPDFFDLTGNEVKAYLWICGVATHLNTPKIRAYVDLCCQQIRLSKKEFHSSVRKLNGKRWDVLNANMSVRVLTGDFGPACPTGQYKTLQDTTGQDTTGIIQVNSVDAGELLVGLWNLHSGSLPKIKAITDERKKAASSVFNQISEADWVEAITKTAQSKFCCGQAGGTWKATFDWFISKRKKDGAYNFIKCLEGNYDNNQDIKELVKNESNYRWAMGET